VARSRAHVFVSGLVQGVFFRESARRLADSLGVVGWTQNLADGRVELVVEGERSQVERVVSWCDHGPSGAEVDEVEVEWSAPTGEFDRFTIRHGHW
jgi:acylphosphatase